jgi:hypothetical protein
MICIDQLKKTQPYDPSGGRWRWKNYCHLFGDDLKELNEFALKIGVKLEYLQNLKDFPHYALTKTMRARAMRAGAVETNLADWLRGRKPQLLFQHFENAVNNFSPAKCRF